MKKIGILGGTFNPVHFGHLRTALEVYGHFKLDKVFFVPSYIPPHKMNDEIASADMRLEMMRIATEDFDGFEVNDIEIARESVSYSIDTVNALKSESDDRIFFIIGSDAFSEISTWKGYDEFIFLCDFVVMSRPDNHTDDIHNIFPSEICKRFSYDVERNIYTSDADTNIYFHEVTKLDISSTAVRILVREGKSIKYLLPESVEEYILKSGLYS